MINAARFVIPALWLAWGLYWLMMARGVKAVARRESAWSRAAHIVPLAIATWLLAFPLVPGWLGWRWAGQSRALFAAGVLLVAAGLGVTFWARVMLGGNWSGTVTVKEDHSLIRSGPYRWVRHPIYTGLLVAFLGSAIARPEYRGIIAVALASVALWRKLRMEEQWMGEKFGAAYAEYRQSTWALIPFVL